MYFGLLDDYAIMNFSTIRGIVKSYNTRRFNAIKKRFRDSECNIIEAKNLSYLKNAGVLIMELPDNDSVISAIHHIDAWLSNIDGLAEHLIIKNSSSGSIILSCSVQDLVELRSQHLR